MAITQYAGDRFVAATTDTKPTGVLPGAFLTVSGDGSRTNYIKTGYTHEAWVAIGGGGGGSTDPAGSNTQVQFNNNGVFGATTGLTFDGQRLYANNFQLSGILYDSNASVGEGGMVLANEGTTGVHWKNIESVLSGVGGSGVANYGARWSDEDTLTSGTIYDDGNVGIGTIAPAAKLDVTHDGSWARLGYDSYATFQFYRNLPASSTSLPVMIVRQTHPDDDQTALIVDQDGSGNILELIEDSTTRVVVKADGKVGIGTTAPWTRFTIAGGTTAEADDFIPMSVSPSVAGGNSAGVLFGVYPVWGYAKQGIFWERYVGNGGYGGRGKLHFVNRDAVDTSVPTIADAKMTILEDGNVGIGTTSPSTLLHIDDDTTAAGLTIKGAGPGYVNAAIVLKATNSTSYRGLGVFMHDAGGDTEWYAGTPYAAADQYMIARKASQASPDYGTAVTGNALFTVKNDGKVGIGTTTPDAELQVMNNDSSSYRFGYAGTSDVYFDADDVYFRSDNGGANQITKKGGSLGIGVVNAEHKLHVAGDAIISGYLYDSTNSTGVDGYVLTSREDGPQWDYIEDILSGVGGNGTANYVPKWEDSDTIGNSIIYDNGSNIGIGNAVPSGTLDIVGSNGTVDVAADGDAQELIIRNNDRAGIQILSSESSSKMGSILFGSASDANGANISYFPYDKLLRLGTQVADGQVALRAANGVEAVRIDAAGKVGIGTNDPSFTLHANGTNGGIIGISRTSGSTTGTLGILRFGNTAIGGGAGDNNLAGINGIQDGATDSAKITFTTQPTGGTTTEQMVIKSDGKVGIGTNAPTKFLHVRAPANSTGGVIALLQSHDTANGWLQIQGNAGNSWEIGVTDSGFQFYDDETAAYKVTIKNSGDVGIGVSSLKTWYAGITQLALGSNRGTVVANASYIGVMENAYLNASAAWKKVAAGGASNVWQDDGTIYLRTAATGGSVDDAITWNICAMDSSGEFGIGTGSPAANLHMLVSGGPTEFRMQAHRNDVGQNMFSAYFSRGTSASPTIVQDGDTLLEIQPKGYDGANYHRAAEIDFQVDGTPGTNDMPGRIIFSTTADGASAPTEHMRIQSDGNVGIGITAPDYKLEVKASVTGNWLSRIYNTATTSNPSGLLVRIDDADSTGMILGVNNNGTYHMVVKGDGNVGIGSSNPAYKLDVRGDYIFVDDGKGIRFGGSSHQVTRETGNELRLKAANTTGFITFLTGGGSEYMRIAADGKVGIGTNAPATALDVADTGTESTPTITVGYASNAARNNYRMAFYTDSEAGYISNKNGNNGIRFQHRSNTIMQVGYGGNATTPYVGIGTPTPEHHLHVSGDAIISGVLYDSTNSSGVLGEVLTSEVGGPQWKMIEDVLSGVGGNGTAEYIPRWTDSDTIGDSVISQSGSNIGINMTAANPATELHIGSLAAPAQGENWASLSIGEDDYPERRTQINAYRSLRGGDWDHMGISFQPHTSSSHLDGPTITGMVIDYDGHVGIGTNSPSVGLQVGNPVLNETKQVVFNSEGGVPAGLTVKARTNRAKLHVADNDSNAYVVAEGLRAFFGATSSGTSTNIAVQTDGNVGIGTTDPAYLFDVRDDSSNIAIFRSSVTNYARVIIRAGAAGDAQLSFQNNTSTKWTIGNDGGDSDKFKIEVGAGAFGASPLVCILSGGNFGIGTDAPAAKLHVNGTLWTQNEVYFKSIGGENRFDFLGTENDGSHGYLQVRNADQSVKVKVSSSGDSYFTGGNFGIGTTSPTTLTELYHASTTDPTLLQITNFSAGDAFINFIERDATGNTNGTKFGEANAWGFQVGYDGGDNKFFIKSGNQETVTTRLAIERDTGNVGIGTNSPSSKLSVVKDFVGSSVYANFGPTTLSGSDTREGGIQIHASSGANDKTWGIWADANNPVGLRFEYLGARATAFGSGTNVLALDGVNNRVGIGTATPGAKLHVYGGNIRISSTDDKPQLEFFETAAARWVIGHSTAPNNYFAISEGSDIAASERLVIAPTTGRVGIGTTSPATKLHVYNAASSTAAELKIENTTAGFNAALMIKTTVADWDVGSNINAAAGSFEVYERTSGSAGSRLTILSGGKVGIGITAPLGILSLPGADTTTKPQIRFQTGGAANLADAAISTTDDSGGTNVMIGANQYWSGGSITRFDTDRSGSAIDFGYAGRMKFYTGEGSAAPTEQMRIERDGNVGIGTDGPVAQLNLFEAGADDAISSSLYFQRAAGHYGCAILQVGNGSAGTEKLMFTAGHNSNPVAIGNAKMTIQQDGNVGIGTVSPATHLHVSKASGTTTVLTQVASNSTVGYEIKKTGTTTQHWKIVDGQTVNGVLEFYDATDSLTRMAIDGNGNVGINDSSPTYKLDVNGTGRFTGALTASTVTASDGGGFIGSGASLTGLNGTNISSGTVAAARLGSGTADSSTFLRGDNTWVANANGTVTSVTAGTGMTQTGTSTINPTLNVIGGTGITANANDIALTNTAVSAASYTYSSITVDAQGRLTAASSGSAPLLLTGGTLTGTLTSRTIAPSADSTYDLGENTARYANLFVDSITSTSAAFSGRVTAGDFEMLDLGGTGRTLAVRDGASNTVKIGDGVTFVTFRFNATQVAPNGNNNCILGASSLRWSTIYGVLGNFSGAVTWSGGGSANANTAYTYSQVGHLPLAGGTLTGLLTSRAITPSADSTYNLGENTVRYANIFGDTAYLGNADGTGLLLGVSAFGGAANQRLQIGGTLAGSSSATAQIAGLTRVGYIITHNTSEGIRPNADGQSTCGTNVQRWSTVYGQAANFNGALTAGSGTFAGSVTPSVDSTYDLGENTNRWTNIFGDNIYGNGANLTSLNASALSSGTVPTARLGTGTADSSTFLRGDNTWVANAGGTVTSVTAGTGMTQSGTSTINPTLNVIGGTGITANANDIAITNTAVSAGSYTYASITVDAQGRLTAASSGSAPGGGTVTGTGSANSISKWTGTNSQGNSTISDNGSIVTIANDVHIYKAGTDETLLISEGTSGSGATNVQLSPNGDSYLKGGDVGIGTSNPAAQLDVYSTGSDPALIRSTSTSRATMSIRSGSGGDAQVRFQNSAASKWTIGNDGGDSNKFKIAVGSGAFSTSEAVAISTSGCVGIGTNSPLEPLHVYDGGDWQIRMSSGGARAGLVIDKPGTTTTMGSALVLADETFKLGTASYYHVVMTQAGVTSLLYQGNTKIATTSSGVTVTGTLTETSSIAIKENVETYTPSLDIINKIRPVKYNRKTNKDKKEIGLIAEELAELFPELVEKDEKGNPSSVNYSRAVAVLLHGFKELYKEVKELKEKI